MRINYARYTISQGRIRYESNQSALSAPGDHIMLYCTTQYNRVCTL